MPYKSDAQRRYFNANRKELESQGVDVDEWNESSRGKKLPEKVKEKKSFDLGSSISNFKLTPNLKVSDLALLATEKAPLGTTLPPQHYEDMARGLSRAGGAAKGYEIGGRLGGGAAAGALAGAGMSLLSDPGYDPKTGKRRNRFFNALKGGLGGAALGGALSAGFPAGEVLGGEAGRRVGGMAGDLAHRMKSGGDVTSLAQEAVKQARCWKGYEPVPGKAPYSEDSCRPAGSGKKKKKEKKAGVTEFLDQHPHAVDFAVRPLLGAGLGYGINSLHEMLAPTQNEDEKRLKGRLAVLGGAGVGLGGATSSALSDYLSKRSSDACSCGCGKSDGECGCDDSSPIQKLARLAVKQAEGAWTREEGQSESGGLNAKGRASLKAQGHDIKPPVTESNPKGERAGRKARFCARMRGMKNKRTSEETANDPSSRINKSLRKWNC